MEQLEYKVKLMVEALKQESVRYVIQEREDGYILGYAVAVQGINFVANMNIIPDGCAIVIDLKNHIGLNTGTTISSMKKEELLFVLNQFNSEMGMLKFRTDSDGKSVNVIFSFPYLEDSADAVDWITSTNALCNQLVEGKYIEKITRVIQG